MGYFSNGTQGICYEEKYCCDCVHYDACRVWLLHLDYNYGQFKEENKEIKKILDMFIPQIGLGNGKCTMYYKPKKNEKVDEIWKLKEV